MYFLDSEEHEQILSEYKQVIRLGFDFNLCNLSPSSLSSEFHSRCRSSHRRCSIKKRVFKNFAKFIGNILCQSLFINKVAA